MCYNKYNKSLFLFLICLISLCSCSQLKHNVVPTLSYIPQDNFEQNLRTIDISDVIGEECELGCITAFESYMFYESCRVDPNTSNYTEVTIYQHNTDTNQSKSVVHISNDESTFFSNELICVGDSLFWVYIDLHEIRIDFYTLSTGTQGTLIEYPPSTPDLMLSGDTRFLTWYIPNETGISLFYFDTKNDNIGCLTENAATDSPYTRAYVSDGVVSFLEDQSDSRLLVIYNLIDQKTEYSCHLSKNFLLTRLQTNSHYTICTDGYSRDSSLYILNKEQGKFEKITIENYDYNIFSCHLYADYVVVNSNLTQSILLISLKSGACSFENNDKNIIQAMISPDGLFYGCNPANKMIYILKL